jgi:hypothetical protein
VEKLNDKLENARRELLQIIFGCIFGVVPKKLFINALSLAVELLKE